MLLLLTRTVIVLSLGLHHLNTIGMLLAIKGRYHLLLALNECIVSDLVVVWNEALAINLFNSSATCFWDSTASCTSKLSLILRCRINFLRCSCSSIRSYRLDTGFTPSCIFELLEDLAFHRCQVLGQGSHSGLLGHPIAVACVEDGRTLVVFCNAAWGWLSHRLLASSSWVRIVNQLLDVIETTAWLNCTSWCSHFRHTLVLSLGAILK